MTHRENLLRAIRFERPERIPMSYHINGSCWTHYEPDALYDLMEAHPILFPGFARPAAFEPPTFHPSARAGVDYTDDFGCVWRSAQDGLLGTVVKHPLEDWAAFDGYRFPDPAVCMGVGPIDWEEQRRNIEAARARGDFLSVGLRHGHTFLQLTDIRSYVGLTYDFADEEPRLDALIEGIERFNMGIIERYLAMDVDMFSYPEDLGMQVGAMLSPAHFRRYILPSYRRMMAPAKARGVLIHMHSDGDIRSLADDILAAGVDVFNVQDLVNGIDWIADRCRGKICVDLDIDRQSVTRFGTPAQVDAMIRDEVRALNTPQGGLMMIFGMYPGMPLENADALMTAMERYSEM